MNVSFVSYKNNDNIILRRWIYPKIYEHGKDRNGDYITVKDACTHEYIVIHLKTFISSK